MIVNQGCTVRKAADAMGIGKFTMAKWVRQLREEWNGKSPIAIPMTPEHRKILEREKKIKRIEGGGRKS